MNPWAYRLTVHGGLAATAGLGAWAWSDPQMATLLGYLLYIPLVPVLIGGCTFVHKMWSAIQDGHARTTPSKAVGLLFLPVFNLYWAFEVFPGYATDYNAYVERHGIDAPPLSRGLLLASLLVPGLGILLFWHVIGRVCRGVVALSG